MRSRSVIGALILGAVASMPLPAMADDADMLNQAMPATEIGKVNKIVDGYSELCDAIRRQMAARLKARKDFCPIPMVDPKAHIRRPDWQPMDVDAARDIISEAVPKLQWWARDAWVPLKQAQPGAKIEELRAAFWSRYGEAILAALRSRPDFFETAMIDVDNNGEKEEVFRIAVLWPADPKKPDGSWTMRPCNANYPTGYPGYGFFVRPENRVKLGTLAHMDYSGELADLFFYRARTFVTTIEPSFMNQIDWAKFIDRHDGSGQTEGFFSQACFIRLDPK